MKVNHALADKHCPACGYHINAATRVDKNLPDQPKPGDYTVCINCGCMGVFNVNLNVVEIKEADVAPHMRDTLKAVSALVRGAQGGVN